MIKLCDLCNQEKECTIFQLHAFIENEEKHEWDICETCRLIFRVVEELYRG
jgi:hypothetical protein